MKRARIRMGKFAVRALVVCLTAALLLGGVSAAAAGGGEGGTIQVFTPEVSDTLYQAMSEYQKLTGVRVETMKLDTIGFTLVDYYELLRELIADGNAPDIVCMPGLPADAFLDGGAFADLSGLTAGREFDGNILAKYTSVDGGIYTLPVTLTVPVLLVNRTLLEEAGLELPEEMSVSDFAELCAQASSKLPGGVAVYGAEEQDQWSAGQIAEEFDLEAYTYFDPYAGSDDDFDTAGFIGMSEQYAALAQVIDTAAVSGDASESQNVKAVEAGELLFARCELKRALEAAETSDALEVVSFPSAGKNPLIVLDAVSVPAEGNTAAAMGFVEYLLGGFQTWLAEHERVALDDAANREYYSGEMVGIIDRATDLSFYGDSVMSVYQSAMRVANMSSSPDAQSDMALNIKDDVESWFVKLAPERISAFMYVVLVLLYVITAAAAAACLYLLVSAVLNNIRRGKAVAQTGADRAYGEIVDTVYSRQMEYTIAAIVALLLSAWMFGIIGGLERNYTMFPLPVRRQFVWVLALAFGFAALFAAGGAFFTKVLLCEKAIVAISVFSVKTVMVENIREIHTGSVKGCMIDTVDGKPVTLKPGSYRDLNGKLNSYMEKMEIGNKD